MTRHPHGISLRLSVLVLVVATLLGASVSWFGTAGWAPTSVRASAVVDIAPLIGTYSNYEVATHAADFVSAYEQDRSAGDAGDDPGAPGPYVDSGRLGDGTIIRVTYVAETKEKAEAGLRRNVLAALDTVATGIEEQLEAEVDGARRAQESLRDQAEDAIDEGVPESAATAAATRAGEIVADASAALRSVQVAQRGNDERVAQLSVSSEPLSTTSTRARATLVAACTAFVLTGAVLLYLRNRATGHRPRRARAPSNGA